MVMFMVLAATAWGPTYITGSTTGRLDHWGNTCEDLFLGGLCTL